jgi:hypothetical protein
MEATQFDARDVLAKYLAALDKPGMGIIRDAAELAHPRDIIKFVLQHSIKTIEASDKRNFLHDAYLSLGTFQVLAEDERKAVVMLGEIGPLASPGTSVHKEQAKRIGDFADTLRQIMDRLKAEVAVLAEELKVLLA